MAFNWLLLLPWSLNSKIDMTIYDMFCMLCMLLLQTRLLKRHVFFVRSRVQAERIQEALLTPFCDKWSCSSCAIWQQCAWHQWLPFLCRDAAVRPPQKPQRRLLRWPWQRPWLWLWQQRWRPPWPLSPRAEQHQCRPDEHEGSDEREGSNSLAVLPNVEVEPLADLFTKTWYSKACTHVLDMHFETLFKAMNSMVVWHLKHKSSFQLSFLSDQCNVHAPRPSVLYINPLSVKRWGQKVSGKSVAGVTMVTRRMCGKTDAKRIESSTFCAQLKMYLQFSLDLSGLC